MLKITSFASSAQKLASHLDYISRNGENEVFDRDGSQFSEIAAETGIGHPREAIQRYGRELASESRTSQKKKGRPRSRVSMNMMLSMPAGTDSAAFDLAVSDFLRRQYAAHDYLYAFHDDRDHYHAHIVVGLQGHDGRWLNPRKNDIIEWRQNFAASLQRRGIAAQATPSYSRGKRKGGYRRDLAELGKRGTRRVPRPSLTYDRDKEDKAIKERANAWSRIAEHYRHTGDREVSRQIDDFIASHFEQRPARAPQPAPSGRGGRGR